MGAQAVRFGSVLLNLVSAASAWRGGVVALVRADPDQIPTFADPAMSSLSASL